MLKISICNHSEKSLNIKFGLPIMTVNVKSSESVIYNAANFSGFFLAFYI